MEEGRMLFPSDDDLIASFAFLNAGPPYDNPPTFFMHLLPEVVGFIQAGREFLCTDVFSERFRDTICVSVPPVGSDEQPSHYAKKEKITMSTRMPTWQREWHRKRLARAYEVSSERLKYYINRYKQVILSEMCEKEADRRYLRRKSEKSVPADTDEEDRPMSVKWGFFEMTRSASPEPTLSIVYEHDPFFEPKDEPMIKSLETADPSARALYTKVLPEEDILMELLSERWEGGVQKVAESTRVPDGLRPDSGTPPEVSISPSNGIPPNELRTLEEEARRRETENRNIDRYRRDNEAFSFKKGLMMKFLEEREAERRADEPSSDSSNSTTTTSSSSGRSAFSSTVDPFELFRVREEEEEGLRIAREDGDNERYQKLVRDHEKHIKFLEEFLHELFWRFNEHPNIVPSVTSVAECIREERELLEEFQRDR